MTDPNPIVNLAFTGVLSLITALAVADPVTVTLNVLTDDPNDPNVLCDPNYPVQADASSAINYYVTARVEPNDANVTSGLGALFVTLKTSFATTLNQAGDVHDLLEANYPSLGLPYRNEAITDIGGSQDLTADSAAQPLALGQTTVVAQGTLTTPANDGTYHVYIIPQIVSVLEPNLATGPTGRLPDDVNIGQGFYVVIGQTTYFALTTGTSHSAEHIIRDPELATYPNGMWVTLTGTENTYDFREFHHYDPNLDYGSHLGDANYYTVDSNNPTLVLMDQNRAVGAQYECGGSAGGEGALMLPLAGIVGILGTAWTIRRLRFHS